MTEPRDEELSRIYREADAPEPPRRIDDAILAASRRAAGSRPRAARPGLVRRWGAPVALAATVILTFTLTLIVSEQPPEFDGVESPPVPREPAASRADKLTQSPSAEPRPATPVPIKSLSKAEAPRNATGQRPAESAAAGEIAGAREPAFVPDAPRAPDVLRERRATELAPAAPAPGASPGRDAASTVQGAAPARGVVASRLETSEAKERPPEKWLEDIRRLKAQGKEPEAMRELAEFKRRHPDYRLPEDLR